MSELDEEGFQKTMILAPSARGGDQKLPDAELTCQNPETLPDPVYGRIRLRAEAVTIGRSPDNTVSLGVEGISRQHARVFPGGDVWGIQDLGSTNGVVVNGVRVKDTWLKHGDTVQLGRLKFAYEELARRPRAEPEAELGEATDQTLVMNPGKAAPRPPPAPAPAPEPPPADVAPAARSVDVGGSTTQKMSRPARAEGTETAARPRSRVGRSEQTGSNVFLWLLGALVVILLIALVSFFV